MSCIYIDADACPVKEEVYRVAGRHGLQVVVVANSWMRTPLRASLRLQVVGEGSDAADDWIVERLEPFDVVITADLPLAARCVALDAEVLAPNGRRFTAETIGESLSLRDFSTELRSGGQSTGGPAPFRKSDRSRFLHQLDEVIRSVLRSSTAQGEGRATTGEGSNGEN